MNAQKEVNFRGSRKLLQAHEKVCDENERNKQIKKKKTTGAQEIANAISIPINRLLNSVYPGLFGQVQICVTQEFDFRITSDVGQIYFGLTRLIVCFSSLMQ